MNAGPEMVRQTWTRTSVRNDSELSAIANQSVGVTSKHTILSHHPWVDDVEKELEQIRQEEEEEAAAGQYDPFQQQSGAEDKNQEGDS